MPSASCLHSTARPCKGAWMERQRHERRGTTEWPACRWQSEPRHCHVTDELLQSTRPRRGIAAQACHSCYSRCTRVQRSSQLPAASNVGFRSPRQGHEPACNKSWCRHEQQQKHLCSACVRKECLFGLDRNRSKLKQTERCSLTERIDIRPIATNGTDW